MAAETAVMSDTDLVLRRDEGPVARLTLNRPEQYNALSLGLMRALQRELDALSEDRGVRAVVIEGAGRGFCAGHDLKELRADPRRETYAEVFDTCCRMMTSILTLPQPVIAKVHGIAAAAGCQLVATCDLAVADEETRFATPGVNIGLFCSTPMVAISRNVGRKQTMEMLLTGEAIDAPTAVSWGLINRAVPATELEASAAAFAEKVAEKSPHVVAIGKRAYYEQLDMPVAEAYRHTAKVMTDNMMARDAAEGIDAFIEKRTPRWTGA